MQIATTASASARTRHRGARRCSSGFVRLERTTDEIAGPVASLSPAELCSRRALRHRAPAEPLDRGAHALRTVLGKRSASHLPPLRSAAAFAGARARSDAGSGIDFNVSQTRHFGLIGVARGLPERARVGVDIEHMDREVGADRLARKFLTPREQASLAHLDADERRKRFLRYWTCKEAMRRPRATGSRRLSDGRRRDRRTPRLLDGPPPTNAARWTLLSAAVPADLVRNGRDGAAPDAPPHFVAGFFYFQRFWTQSQSAGLS